MPERREKIHFIAIGGVVMHNLAIALQKEGHQVTGSDDEFYEPSRSNLSAHHLLPEEGWNPDKIDSSLDYVVLGMHAKKDNPELQKALALNIPILSYPEVIHKRSLNKQRIVVAGSHGKTTITAMIIHVLNYHRRNFDYVIGSPIDGLSSTLKLSDAPLIVIEGDEYLSSILDPTPKFIRYQHHIGVISGISWDHANVFPTEESYVKQFDLFADQTPKAGIIIYCEQDPLALIIGKKERQDVTAISYKAHLHQSDGKGNHFLTHQKEKVPIKIFGSHNYQNISGAKEVLRKIGITNEQFYEAISGFDGAHGRLERVKENERTAVFKDFAHAPSKVIATIKAVREAYPNRKVVACLELHTYSSLSRSFLPQYRDSMKAAQIPLIYYNPRTSRLKNLEPLSTQEILDGFANPAIKVFNDAQELEEFLLSQAWEDSNLLLMSSGNFGRMDISQIAEKIIT